MKILAPLSTSQAGVKRPKVQWLVALFIFLGAIANNGATAQSCPVAPPWDKTSDAYGTIMVQGSGTSATSTASQTTNQSIAVGVHLTGLGCQWDSPPGVMTVYASVNDQQS